MSCSPILLSDNNPMPDSLAARTTPCRRNVRAFVAGTFGVLCLLASLYAPRALEAASLVSLKASRTCIVAGEPIRIRLSSQGSLPATVTVLQKRLIEGEWHTVTPTIKTFTLSTASKVFILRPPRGRYRYAMIVKAADGIRMTKTIEFSVVSKKVVALTFDDGPWPTYTTAVLRALKQRNVLGTFFMCGYTVKARPEVGRKVVRLGHEVGNHSFHHPVLTRLSNQSINRQILSTQKLVRWKLGVTPKWFRPPYGATNYEVRRLARKNNLNHILWTVDSSDWRLRSGSSIAGRVLRRARPDSVVLLHDGGGNRQATVNALPSIVHTLKVRGYDFVTLSELKELKRNR